MQVFRYSGVQVLEVFQIGTPAASFTGINACCSQYGYICAPGRFHKLPACLTISSYAKVNYTLDVLSLRPDGYHNIASVMQTISLADTLSFFAEEEPGFRFECKSLKIPTGQSNLVYRAAESILNYAGSKAGVRIVLDKRIPTE